MTERHRKRATRAHTDPGKPTTPRKAVITSGDGDHNTHVVSAEDIRLCAYQKWETSGRPTGDSVPFWLKAEQELRQRK
jgi:hypothetical protein